jgi:endonuclease III
MRTDSVAPAALVRRLHDYYGQPTYDPLPLGNKRDPLNELIFILLTVQTQYGVDETFEALKRRFPTWDAALRAREATLARILQPLGLSSQRSRRLRVILRRLRDDFGECTLEPLRAMDDVEAEGYLRSLPGVGPKVARCVLMYSLGRNLLPVDAHVYRVAQRIGLLEESVPYDAAHDAIHEVVPPPHRYSLHVNLVRLGRDLCDARQPKCEACPLRERCTGP